MKSSIVTVLILCLLMLISCTNGPNVNVKMLDRLGDFDASQGNYVGAIEEYDKAIRWNPHDGETYIKRGFAYEKLGDDRRAISDYTKALEIFPDDSELYVMRGIIYAKTGENQKALYDYSKAIGLDPTNRDAYIHRAEIFKRLGNIELSKGDLQKADTLK
ncbi:MAG TPA: tetratricopeptide repeat protein [Syntrophorhabdaceae bacterium]|nr:tetratricopeptide repeat protein [Syntrophorhabdaceae bacterium]HQM81414.1 tetratricopeptide repeat protein [Syntrophorhabdaceae bacterium]